MAALTERLPQSPEDLRPCVLFAADRVFRGALEALAHVDEWEKRSPFTRGYHIELTETFALTLGVRPRLGDQRTGADQDPDAEKIWERLRRAPDLATKLQFALWAAYFEGGGNPSTHVWTPLLDLVDRVGYSRHGSRRVYSARDARLVEDTLVALFALEATVCWSTRDRRREWTLRGHLWQESLVASERHLDQREKRWISHQPGQWFSDQDWRRQNRFVGRVSTALLELDANRDRWAIRFGAAYAWLARANLKSGPILTQRVRPLVEQAGASEVYRGRPAQLRAVIEAAHARLVEVGLLREWRWLPGPANSDWSTGSIRVEWIAVSAPLACNECSSRLQGVLPSPVMAEIDFCRNRSNRLKRRPRSQSAGPAPSSPTTSDLGGKERS